MAKTVGLTFKKATPAPEVEKYTCPVCGKEYKSQEALAKHIKEKHPEGAEQPQE